MKMSAKFSTLIAAGFTAALLSSAAFVVSAETVTMGNEGAMQIEAELKTKMEAAGLQYPTSANLTFAQVQELLVVFNKKDATEGKPTQAELNAKAEEAKLILNRISTTTDLSRGNLGAMQIADQLAAQLERVGLPTSGIENLTISQTRELVDMFSMAYKSEAEPTEAEKAAVAVKAQQVLDRSASPSSSATDTPEVIALRRELVDHMAAIGLELDVNKALTLNQIVELLTVFQADDSEAVKSANDPVAARVIEQTEAVKAMLSTM